MMRWRKRSLRFWSAAGLAIGIVSPCLAIDYQPFDWIPAPPGTSVVLVYYDFGAHNEFDSPITGTAKNNTNLDSYMGVARYLHYGEISGHPYAIDFIQPFGALVDGKIAGKRLGDTSGLADPIASVGYWFVSQPDKKRYLSAVIFLTVPIGSYDSRRSLNLGENRWQSDLQADYTQGFLNQYTFDIAADRIWYGDNTRAGAGRQTLSQSATYTAYSWLSRDITPEIQRIFPEALGTSISIGYAGTFGGSQRLDGVRTGGKTHEHQIRFTYMQSISPTWQGTISFSHDVEARGQFKQNYGVLVRIAKAF